jgi:hypothetical protein
MTTRKAYQNVVTVIFVVISFLSAMGIACNDGPANCTDPVTCAAALAVPTQQNILSGGQP